MSAHMPWGCALILVHLLHPHRHQNPVDADSATSRRSSAARVRDADNVSSPAVARAYYTLHNFATPKIGQGHVNAKRIIRCPVV